MHSRPASESPSSRTSSEAQRNVRYSFLLGRLRNRQITMEEATELFELMQTMLRMSEAARLAATRTPAASLAPTAPPRLTTAPAAPSSSSDDLFLLGLITMGAGAGLMTAVARRLTEGPLPATAAKRSGTGSTDPPR